MVRRDQDNLPAALSVLWEGGFGADTGETGRHSSQVGNSPWLLRDPAAWDNGGGGDDDVPGGVLLRGGFGPVGRETLHALMPLLHAGKALEVALRCWAQGLPS